MQLGLTPREHAHLARTLIDACGGVDELDRQHPPACRVGRSRLYDFANGRAFMPADVMADLEAYAGEPLYSRVLVERRPHRADTASPTAEACGLGEHGLRLQALIREAESDGVLTPREMSEIEAGLTQAEQLIRRVRAASTSSSLRVAS